MYNYIVGLVFVSLLFSLPSLDVFGKKIKVKSLAEITSKHNESLSAFGIKSFHFNMCVRSIIRQCYNNIESNTGTVEMVHLPRRDVIFDGLTAELKNNVWTVYAKENIKSRSLTSVKMDFNSILNAYIETLVTNKEIAKEWADHE
jgi:hypothetical protein